MAQFDAALLGQRWEENEMDLALLDGKLEKAFARSSTEVIAAGTLKRRRAPAPLWKHVEEVADADDREQFDDGSL